MGAVADAIFIKELSERVKRLEEIVSHLAKAPRPRRKYKKRKKTKQGIDGLRRAVIVDLAAARLDG